MRFVTLRKKHIGMAAVTIGLAFTVAACLVSENQNTVRRIANESCDNLQKLSDDMHLAGIDDAGEGKTAIILPAAISSNTEDNDKNSKKNHDSKRDFIKWVDFNIPYEALNKSMALDVKYYGTATEMPWIDMLAVLACKYGGDFSRYRESDLIKLAEKIKQGGKIDEIIAGLTYFDYYKQAYTAVLGGFLGEYDIQTEDENGIVKWERKYGLKAFSPIAKGYEYSHYDDFGDQRTYGYTRRHLGHDMIGQVGTPIVAVESGVVEAVGWNRYGGWRVGIRSFDKKRYYYYAHLRKNHPYHGSLKEGDIVMAGDVIGYLGRSGYSIEENVNNIKTPHLHIGMELIFDESQKDSASEIWIDLYSIMRLLDRNKSAVYKNAETKDYYRKYAFAEDIPERFVQQSVHREPAVLS